MLQVFQEVFAYRGGLKREAKKVVEKWFGKMIFPKTSNNSTNSDSEDEEPKTSSVTLEERKEISIRVRNLVTSMDYHSRKPTTDVRPFILYSINALLNRR